MWHNHIGDGGIAAIAESLSHSHITLLDVKKCGISIGGVRSLAAVFQNIREIDIGSNPITVDGAHLIMKSAVENGVCEYVGIDSKYKDDKEVKRLITILDDRRRIQNVRNHKLCCI